MRKEVFFDRITAKNVGFDLALEASNVANALQKAPDFRKDIIETAARQIRTYESETLEDNVVSFYPCFVHSFDGKTKLFSAEIPDKRFLIEAAIDPLERGGKALDGFKILQERIGEASVNKKVFLWISPRGSAGKDGIYKDINYRYHQIYIGEIDGRKTKAYALKSDIDEGILADWINRMSHGSISIEGKTAEEFLLNSLILPFSSGQDILENVLFSLKKVLKQKGKKKFYKDIDIDDVPNLVRQKSLKQESDTKKIAEELEKTLSSDRYLGYEEAKKAIGGQMYVLYDRYANGKGEVKLTGCAGGSISIKNLFSNNLSLALENIFSTAFRVQKNLLNQENEWFKCPKCHYQANGPIGEGSCPSCGLTKEAYAKSGKAVCV